MRDVAQLAGVSQTTVSFVINNVPDANIPEETQERVWEAVKELGYRPNALARGLRARRTHTIGFISDEIATTPYAVRMIQGAQDFAWGFEKLLLLVNTGRNQEMKEVAVDVLLERQVDGIIYAAMYHRQVFPPDPIREVPAVLLDCYCGDRSLPSVVPDEVAGGYTATKVLLAKGHRRIGYLNNEDPIPATSGRWQGYQKALGEWAIPYEENLIVAARSDQAGGYDATMALMQQPNPPTALFCFNDRMAMGAYDALRKLNLSIPNDVAVIGFDNQEIIAAHLYPPLTTMELPHYQMGQWAVEHLLHLIDNPQASQEPAVQHKMACPLIERSSV
ncbi:MAG: LacI family DNA-binding transcriptional regulator [Chloroflexi bacterium]|nr:LacI family DNA-binding transcriptional regulator [Chloroflexota bacterium]MCI0575755.1 LacI family DNA-binding transcriptional regulator [Chloroflexota bacterium]MCI0643638.1 LacI family DNA-binding transcriptional regulator [Chloroflexota bacterium]MCI0729821.1 LacI family DNA-binding transcriptional regulator [Chloroflexota bacterium]